MRRRANHTLVAVVLAGVALAGCGGGRGGRATGSSAPEEFGLSLADLGARVEGTEQLIAACMKEQGFTYVAVDFSTIKDAMERDGTAPGLSDEAYLKQYGLGITTQHDKPIVTFGAGPRNMTYLDGLPASDQAAFRRALWGESPEWNHAHAVEAEDFSQTGGCTRAAADKTYRPDELSGTYVNPADVRIQQDPRMVAALAKWSECMRAKGFPYESPDRVDADLVERFEAVTKGQDPRTLTGSALDALKALQGEEVAVAGALRRCEEANIAPVQTALEAEFYGGSPT